MKDLYSGAKECALPSQQNSGFWSALPQITPLEAQLSNAHARANGRFNFPVNGTSVTMSYRRTPPNCPFSEVAEVWLGDHLLEVYLSPGALDRTLEHAGYQQRVHPLSPHVAGIVLDKIVKQHMRPLETLFRGNCLVMNYHTRQPGNPLDPLYLTICTEGGGSPVNFAIDTDPSTKLKILEAFLLPPPAALQDCHQLALSARAAAFYLTRAHLEAMNVGDGLMLPSGWAPDVDNSLVLNQQFIAPATQEDGEFTLVSDFSTSNQLRHRPHIDMSISQDDLEVEISVEIARGHVLARDVEDIGEGSVLDLNIHPDDLVLLRSNERLLAEGKLVRLNERFAIKILRCFQ